MRAVVALVEARPETIVEDYARVLGLAGLTDVLGDVPVALAPQIHPRGWFPGAVSPPWQLDGVLAWLESLNVRMPGGPARDSGTPVVLPVSSAGGTGSVTGWGWEDVLARRGAPVASEHFRNPRSFRAEPALSALETALPRGLNLPAGLRDRATLFLPVPALRAGRPVSGAVDLMRALLAPGLRRVAGPAVEEVQADVIRFARQALPGLGVVMDAVLWQVGRRSGAQLPVARNILLAGADPVAVDAVASRLAGRAPDRDPWFRYCRDHELGAVREGDIRLTGRGDLMDLDFEDPSRAAAGSFTGAVRFPLADYYHRTVRRPSLLKRHARTPWGRLFADYRAGAPAGERE
ncbi:MAG: hypothetical protein ABFS42_15640 [Candidatus Krumholzibacteriota bacterium]